MSHSAEKFHGHPFNVSENLGYRKILGIIGGITFFRRKFSVSQCRKILWASLQCFRKIGVSKNFMHNRGYHDFPLKNFRLTVLKNFVEEPVGVWENFGYRKNLRIRGEGQGSEYDDFPSKLFCLYA